MLGAITGDMIGSRYEFNPIKSKNFKMIHPDNRMTDDSYLTIEVAKVLLQSSPIDYSEEGQLKIKENLRKSFINSVSSHPNAGWGGLFYLWSKGKLGNYDPYNSYGNGSAMRISPVGWFANSVEEVKILSKTVSEVTHNHPEGIKGAEAIAMCIYLARIGKTKDYIKDYISTNYYPEILNFNFDDLVKTYTFSEICQKSCPQAIYCFLISESLEDTIRNCVAIGGDCDTTGAMAGAIAEAYYEKDKMSEFEDKFQNLFIDPEIMDLFKKIYRLSGSTKLG